MRLLSRPEIFPFYRQAVSAANVAVGRWGNKLCLVASRPRHSINRTAP
jgi:hypothetical protein